MSTLIETVLERGAPDHPAILVPDGPSITYRELRELCGEAALALGAAGVKHADSLLREQVTRLTRLGKAVLLVEQPARAAPQIADWTSVFVSGAVRLEGRPADLLRREDFEELFLGAGTALPQSTDSNGEEA